MTPCPHGMPVCERCAREVVHIDGAGASLCGADISTAARLAWDWEESTCYDCLKALLRQNADDSIDRMGEDA